MSSVTLCMDHTEGAFMPRLETFINADARVLNIYIVDGDGDAVDLTSKSCFLAARDGGVSGDVILDEVGLVVKGAAAGWLQYVDDPVFLSAAAELDAQVHVQDNATSDMDYTERFILDVQPIIAGSPS
jgi:hypothetical protein